jgi:flagella basal body P-ring formation protein FlgA
VKTLMVLLTLGLSFPALADEPLQSLDAIRDAAREFVLAHQSGAEYAARVRVGDLDPRLRLGRCDTELQARFLVSGSRSGSRTVRVACAGSKPWSLYVPVRVRRIEAVVVLARPVAPGAVLRLQDLRVEERDIGRLAAGYFTNPEQLVGKEMRRSLGVGQPVSRLAVIAPTLLRRGDRVTFLARAGGLEVRMQGEMVTDGAAGDRVRVRNLRSNRIVEGELGSDGTVVIKM